MVVRINKEGELCNARPCYKCLEMMKSVGIRKIYYSVSKTEIICEAVKNMISIQASAVTKQIERLNGNMLVDDKNIYYSSLIKKFLPPIIRQHNFDSFIKYNLNHVLPKYTICIESQKGIKYGAILDENLKTIISTIIRP